MHNNFSMITRSGKAWTAGMLAALSALAFVGSARAGTYVINNCPSAPIANGDPGPWTIFGSPQADQGSCAGRVGNFIGPLGAEMNRNTFAGVQITVPAGSGIKIREAIVWWTVSKEIAGATTFAIASANGNQVWQAYTPISNNSSPTAFKLPSTTTSFTLANYCSSDDYDYGCIFGGGENLILQLFGAQLTLEDNSLPTGSVTGGALAGSETVIGTQALTYTATDSNSGIRVVNLLVDGKSVAQNDYLAQCPYENFLACPATISDTISWNTATASAGTHEVALSIRSASENTTIVGDHLVTVLDGTTGAAVGPVIGPGSPAALRGSTNGVNASDKAKLTAHWGAMSKATLTGRYGMHEHITGRLTTSAGQSISGASLDVYATPTYQGARTRRLENVHTGATGKWTLTLPANASSCALRVNYRSHASDTVAVAKAALNLRVHAGLTLHITPRMASVRHRIFFSGVLHGTPIPPGGKQLVLEASSGGEWIQFDTIRTDAKGHYHASYRFKFPGPVTYRFRVFSPYEADFPFLNGASSESAVHEF